MRGDLHSGTRFRRAAGPDVIGPSVGSVRGSGGWVEAQRGVDAGPETAPTGRLDPDGRLAFLEPPLEENEAALEIVAELRKFQRRVEPHLLVGELDLTLVLVVTEQ